VKRKLRNFCDRPVLQTCKFCLMNVFTRTPPFCGHSSQYTVVYNVLDPSSLALNLWIYTHIENRKLKIYTLNLKIENLHTRWIYTHIEVCNDPVQYLLGNSPDLFSNIILEGIISLGFVSTLPFKCPHKKQSKKGSSVACAGQGWSVRREMSWSPKKWRWRWSSEALEQSEA